MKKAVLFIAFFILIGGIQAQSTFTTSINASENDAEESQDGTEVDVGSSDLEMVDDGNDQIIGLRFGNITILNDATIDSAFIQFTADGDYQESTNLVFKGEGVANSSEFEEVENNISARQSTTAQVAWDNIDSWVDLEATSTQRTPDLTTIVSEIINRNNWQQGNAMTFMISGTGKRKAFSYDGSATFAAKLVIHYTSNTIIYNDLGIDDITSPNPLNYPNSSMEVGISIHNYGADPQSNFMVSYSINNETPVVETVTETINSEESFEYTFMQTADLGLADLYTIQAAVILPGDENDLNDSSSVKVEMVAYNDTLFFNQGSPWNYLDDGSDQGTAWQALSFDDSEWQLGQGHMGFGESDQTTTLTSGFITYYFRKIVNIVDTSLLDEIYFNIVHDDGAVVYVNGVEVIRSTFMPTGTIDYLTGTTTFIPNDVENDFWTYEVDKSHFKNGENIIAIEVHNQRVGSSDLSFDCYVSDNFENEFDLDGPYVFYRDGKVEVKTVESNGPNSYIYDTAEEAVLVCRFPDGSDSFTVQIQPNLDIQPDDYDLPNKFLAVSDIEGNLEGFVMVLQDAGVIDSAYNWTFGAGHLIFNGDMFDRGNNVVECLWLIYRLEQQALLAGGHVHFIIGNHEILNLEFDFRYVAQKYLTNVQLIDETLESLYTRDTELGRWLRSKNIIEKIGPFIFVHGGLSAEVSALGLTYEQINNWGRYAMDSVCQTYDCEAINGGSEIGIYWYRGMAEQEISQAAVDLIISSFGGEQVVIGHTVFDTISLLYEDKVICIDLDHKENFANGFMSAFYYENGKIYDFRTDGENQTYKLLNTISAVNQVDQGEDFIDLQVFPNPMASTSTIQYTLPTSTGGNSNSLFVTLNVIDGKGNLIKQLVHEKQSTGTYSAILDGKTMSSGVYFYQLTVDTHQRSGKIVLMK